jgi:hypothetical protein
MRCKAEACAACALLGLGTAMPMGIASICNAAARPYRMDSTDPISVIQWTSPHAELMAMTDHAACVALKK